MIFPYLRQAQASLLAGLLDCSNPEVYPREAAAFWPRGHARYGDRTPAAAAAGFRHA